MRTPGLHSAATTLLLLAVVVPCSSSAATSKTTVAFLPQVAKTDAQTFPCPQGTTLTFDLRALPAGAAIKSANLQITPTSNGSGTVTVNIFNENGKASITVDKDLKPFSSRGTGLGDAVQKAQPKGMIALRLEASPQCNRSFFSGTAAVASKRPRLIVSWEDSQGSVERVGAGLRYRDNPEDQTPWRINAPNGAVLSQLKFQELLTGPAFVGDEIVAIARQDTSTKPMLYRIGWGGNVIQRCKLPSLESERGSWADLSVLPGGGLVAFANDWHQSEDVPKEGRERPAPQERVQVFDFGPRDDLGCPVTANGRWTSASFIKHHPAVSPGGIIVFVDRDGVVHGLTPPPTLDELWTFAKVPEATAVMLSPASGDGLLYLLGSGGLRVISPITGEVRFPKQSEPPTSSAGEFPPDNALAKYAGHHPPLIAQGPQHDWVLLSSYGTSNGTLKGFSDFSLGSPNAWNASLAGPISRCVVPAPEDPGAPVAYCVQNGRFRGFKIFNGEQVCPATRDGGRLDSTSSLVADGSGNVYFWSERTGFFYGFDRHCARLFRQRLSGIPRKPEGKEVVEMRMSPHGVVTTWTNDTLFAIQLVGAAPPKAWEAATRYGVAGDLAVTSDNTISRDGPIIISATQGRVSFRDFKIPEDASLSCSAATAVEFGPGFSVERGGSLRCSTDKFEILPAPPGNRPGTAASK